MVELVGVGVDVEGVMLDGPTVGWACALFAHDQLRFHLVMTDVLC